MLITDLVFNFGAGIQLHGFTQPLNLELFAYDLDEKDN